MKLSGLPRRRGLSQVVTTLIILVVSVFMAGGTLTYYTTAVASNSIKMEQLVIRDASVWVNETGAQVALVIENVGGRDTLIDCIEVRFSEVPWSSVYVANGSGGILTPVETLNITGAFVHTVGVETLGFNMAHGSILMPIGESIILYLDQPDNLSLEDVGSTAYVTIYTPTLQYLAVVDVELA